LSEIFLIDQSWRWRRSFVPDSSPSQLRRRRPIVRRLHLYLVSSTNNGVNLLNSQLNLVRLQHIRNNCPLSSVRTSTMTLQGRANPTARTSTQKLKSTRKSGSPSSIRKTKAKKSKLLKRQKGSAHTQTPTKRGALSLSKRKPSALKLAIQKPKAAQGVKSLRHPFQRSPGPPPTSSIIPPPSFKKAPYSLRKKPMQG